jgi:hypothetical protein
VCCTISSSARMLLHARGAVNQDHHSMLMPVSGCVRC